jgi:DNA-binding MarR family transcriptional regulator/GNAT superfamily N-acetyltransferase
MSGTAFARRVAAVRRFNRFYTRQIGVLHEGLLKSPFSLTEVRVLFELAHRDQPTAGDLIKEMGIDGGYLSRILRGFAKRGLVEKTPSSTDGRQSHLALSPAGKATFAPLNRDAHDEIAEMLRPLPVAEQHRLIAAMDTIEALLGPPPQAPRAPYLLRPHRPGDMGWVVSSHGSIYAEEYGWNEEFEALVAEIVAKFLRHFDGERERCWIAEREGERVGSVFLVKHSARVAKLRLLIVDPKARGLGIGQRLVEECIRFARQVSYRKIILWTNNVLRDARRLYKATGFRLVREEPHHSFGKDLVGETWELTL